MAIIRMQDVRAQVEAHAQDVTGAFGACTWAIDQKDSDKVHVHLNNYARLSACVPVPEDVRKAVKAMKELDPSMSFPVDVARSLWASVGDALTNEQIVEFVKQMATCASVTVKLSEDDRRADKRLDNAQPAGKGAVCPDLVLWYDGRRDEEAARLRELRITRLMETGMSREDAEKLFPVA